MTAELEPTRAVLPDRGGTILTLGIVSMISALFGVPLGVLPWVMGSRDLKAMNQGVLDPAGRRTTQAGWTLGIVGTVVAALALLTMGWAIWTFGSNGQPEVIQVSQPVAIDR
jgi:hypothetical protein